MIKPCPFCGSAGAFTSEDGKGMVGSDAPEYFVRCTNRECRAETKRVSTFDTRMGYRWNDPLAKEKAQQFRESLKQAAIDIWNRRVARIEDLEEALSEATNTLRGCRAYVNTPQVISDPNWLDEQIRSAERVLPWSG